MAERILVVDDDRQMALAMVATLRQHYDVSTANSGTTALSRLEREPFDLMVTDLRMPGMDGRELMRQARTVSPTTTVVVVTAFATVESAVRCVREGAADYMMKPFSPEMLVDTVARCMRPRERSSGDAHGETRVIARDPAILAALNLARRAAAVNATVLLEAESGAGKEVFSRIIHRDSPRSGGPFVAVNCAALPRELLEAELFGHARGAFTGAYRDRRGYFQMADGGTLLLDEIGEMCPELQARLLRVLQERSVQPIGRESPIPIDVRVIAATNRNLRRDVAEHRFRQDLYYRLRVVNIRIPPLRERPRDIEPLAMEFVRRFAGPQMDLTPAALAQLKAHSWPGNVRELQNALHRASILADGVSIDAKHIELEPFHGDLEPTDDPVTLEGAERDAIRTILIQTGGNRGAAAAALGISPRTLRHKLKRYRDEGRPLLETP